MSAVICLFERLSSACLSIFSIDMVKLWQDYLVETGDKNIEQFWDMIAN